MKTLRFLSALLLLCFLPVCVFAMDTELIHNPSEWYNRADIDSLYFEDDETLSEKLEGYCKYYLDFSEHCFYIHLSYETKNDRIDNTSNVFLHFTVKNSSHEYDFNIDKNGFYKSDERAMKAFHAEADFDDIYGNGQEISAGIEFLNKEDKMLNNTIEIELHISNGLHFKIPVNDRLDFGDYAASLTTAKPTTTKQTTTKHTATKPSTEAKTTTKKTTEKTTKKPISDEAITVAEKTTKTKPESTTKFKYTPTTASEGASVATSPADSGNTLPSTSATASTAATEKYSISQPAGSTAGNKPEHNENTVGAQDQTAGVPDDTAPSQSGDIIIPEVQTAGGLSPQAKLLAALAVVFAVSGAALIIRGLPKKDDENDINNEKEE